MDFFAMERSMLKCNKCRESAGSSGLCPNCLLVEPLEERACRERRQNEFQAKFSCTGRAQTVAKPDFPAMNRPPAAPGYTRAVLPPANTEPLQPPPLYLAWKKEAVLASACRGGLSVGQLRAVMDNAALYGFTADEMRTLRGIRTELGDSIGRGYSFMVDNANTVDWWSRPRD
jgi:hypothetical protein